jgi:hypothetical protein
VRANGTDRHMQVTGYLEKIFAVGQEAENFPLPTRQAREVSCWLIGNSYDEILPTPRSTVTTLQVRSDTVRQARVLPGFSLCVRTTYRHGERTSARSAATPLPRLHAQVRGHDTSADLKSGRVCPSEGCQRVTSQSAVNRVGPSIPSLWY